MKLSRTAWVWIALFAASAAAAFARLGDTAFWDDEAFVAILARNLLRFGRLTVWDGRNFLAVDGIPVSRSFAPTVLLDVPTAAASFRLFGESVWAGRLPFVLAGLAALAVLYVSLRLAYLPYSAFRIYAFGLFALSTLFLLNVRNCRYYALALLFSQIVYLAYRLYLQRRQARYALLLGIAGVLLFFSHYLCAAAFLGALAVYHLIFHRRDLRRSDVPAAMAAVGILTAAIIPFALLTGVWSFHHLQGDTHSPLMRHLILVLWNLRDLNLVNALPWIALIVLVCVLSNRDVLAKHREIADEVLRWTTLGLLYVGIVGLLSIQPVAGMAVADIRYDFPAAPFVMSVPALLLYLLHQRSRPAAGALFGVAVCTNLLTLTPFPELFPATQNARLLLPAYVREISSHYTTANEVVARFVRRNARRDDLVQAEPNYLNYPLIFETGDLVKVGAALDYRTPLDRQQIHDLRPSLFLEESYPDWLILFGNTEHARAVLEHAQAPHIENGRMVRREYKLHTAYKIYWNQTQRPEIFSHTFGRETSFNPRAEAVYIFHGAPAP